jgi:amidase
MAAPGPLDPFAPAHRMAAAVAAREVSSLELVDLHLERIARDEKRVNAVVTLDAERARDRARAADAALARGTSWGPLHGVPFTLKDAWCTAGVRTVVGSPELANHVPDRDATVCARLRVAGGILLGKSNTPTMASRPHTDNPVFGRTSNPWNLEHTAGGSSGGSCAAVAAGMSPLDVGSDMAGSIRMPAHLCGVYGIKPTARRVSGAGHIPDPPGVPRSDRHLASGGPIARSVADLALALELLVGADGRDTEVPPVPWRKVAAVEPRALKVAFAATLPGVPASQEIQDAVTAAARALEQAGARVEERLPAADFAQHRAAWLDFLRFGMFGIRDVVPPGTFNVPLSGETPRPGDLFRALHGRDQAIADWDALLAEWDLFLCPAMPTTAPRHGAPMVVDGAEIESWRVDHMVYPFNFTGHPAMVIPAALGAGGLPIGVQLVGGRWRDEELCAAAAAVDRALGGFRPPPGSP